MNSPFPASENDPGCGVSKPGFQPFATVLVNGVPYPVYVSKSRGHVEYAVKFRVPSDKGAKFSRVTTRDVAEVPQLGARAEAKIEEEKKPKITLYGAEAVAYRRAVVLLKKFKMPLDVAVGMLVRAWEMLKGYDLIRAVGFCADKGLLRCKPITFSALVELYCAKEFYSPVSAAPSIRLARTLGDWVREKVRDPNVQLVDVPMDVFDGWVHQPKPWSRKWRDGHRKFIGTLYRFAVSKGYWPPDVLTPDEYVGEVHKVRGKRPPPEIFEAGALQKLIEHLWGMRAVHPKFEKALISLLFRAFAPMRWLEMSRVTWQDIDLATGRVRVEPDAAKTQKQREFFLPPNLLAFLRMLDLPEEGSLVDKGWESVVNRECLRMGWKWPRNGPRHSFASAWYALVGHARMLAYIMGNSLGELRDNYLAQVTYDWAQAHFAIYPPGYEGPRVAGNELVAALKAMVPKKALAKLEAKPSPPMWLLPPAARGVLRDREKWEAALASATPVVPSAATAAPVMPVEEPVIASAVTQPTTRSDVPAEKTSAEVESAPVVVSVVPASVEAMVTPTVQGAVRSTKPRVPKSVVKRAKRCAWEEWSRSSMRKRGEPMPKNAWEMYVDWNKYSRR